MQYRDATLELQRQAEEQKTNEKFPEARAATLQGKIEELEQAHAAEMANKQAELDLVFEESTLAFDKQQELEAAKVAAEEALDHEIANATELEAAKTAAEEAQAAAEEALDHEIVDKAELEEKVEALKVE
eukprot:COSAG06_NODE_27505_length_592_cov_0.535497_1_plen_129_part_01